MKTVAALTISLNLVGCSTSSYVAGSNDPRIDYTYEEFNKDMENRECTIVFTSGEEIPAKQIVASRDSVSWNTYTRMIAPLSQVSLVRRSTKSDETTVVIVDGRGGVVDRSSSDSVWWMQATRFAVPTSQIAAIYYVNHAQGLFEGLLTGAVVGPALFVGIGLAGPRGEAGYARLAYGLILGGGTILAAPITFGIIGHKHEFGFSTSWLNERDHRK